MTSKLNVFNSFPCQFKKKYKWRYFHRFKDKNKYTQTMLNDKDLKNDNPCRDTSSKVSIASHRSRNIRKLSMKVGKQGPGTGEVS